MADYHNLLPGDSVNWITRGILVPATVQGKTPQKVAIRFEHKGEEITKYVDAKDLRLIFGGRKRLEREAAKFARPLKAYPSPMAEPPAELFR